jgi:hypothetical protein
MNVMTFSYKGIEINLTNRNGFIAYTFHYGADTHGQKIKSPKKIDDKLSATSLLILNAVDTINKLNESNT